ncbi:hypothetical protein V490_07463 [Pseudogymnoascus sp. VKM F-3557]|nr:hypothetical protein V490_07463 [Pseudogymnoascus sp. VKM F-3557]
MLLIFVLGWTPLEQLSSLAFLRNASLDRRRQHNTPNQHKKNVTATLSMSQRSLGCQYTADIPDLSGSVGVETIESDNEGASTPAPLTTTIPHVTRQHSVCDWSQGKERRFTSDDLEEMVKEKKNLQPSIMRTNPYPAPLARNFMPSQLSNPGPEKISKTSSTASKRSPTLVVRGFFSPQISSPYRPDNKSFSGSSLERRMQPSKRNKAPSNMFQFGGSSAKDDNSHRSSLSDATKRPEQHKKQTSVKGEVATRTTEEMSGNVSETDVGIDESAIDDDESSDWEDSMEESGKSSTDYKLSFPRVESRRNLTSRRSLITTMIHQNDGAAALQSAASKSTPALQRSRTSSPQGPSDAPSPDSDDSAPLTMKSRMRPGQEVPRPGAQPIIMTTTNVTPHQAALSPKTTRRQMLATELTASLRRHLLWERKQKNQTASAVLKRMHTAHDVANLKQYPDKVHLGTEDKGDHGSWNQYFGQGLGEYHSKGW